MWGRARSARSCRSHFPSTEGVGSTRAGIKSSIMWDKSSDRADLFRAEDNERVGLVSKCDKS